MAALDKDRNGSLSAEEIKGSASALRSLDQDDDGSLNRTEVCPPHGPRRPPGSPPHDVPDGPGRAPGPDGFDGPDGPPRRGPGEDA